MSNHVENECNKLYGLGLHEVLYGSTHKITRVPGGWIYESQSNDGTNDGHKIDQSVFIPFDNEFYRNPKGFKPTGG